MFVSVRFNSRGKEYVYKTSLSLQEGCIYRIVVDGRTTYDNTPILVTNVNVTPPPAVEIRTITSATLVKGLPHKSSGVAKIIFNKEKNTTVVVWNDKTTTKLHCSPNDVWDEEKAIALLYMKKLFGGSYFNDIIKELRDDAERVGYSSTVDELNHNYS